MAKDGKKQYLAAKLAAHTATEAERDEALGTILLSLWEREDVEEIVEEKHVALCKDCPARKAVDEGGTKNGIWHKLMFELVKLVALAIVVLGSVAGAAKYAEAIARGAGT